MKRLAFLLLAVFASGALYAQSVIASTSWTGAFAQVAGAEDVRVLAPFDLTHPPEYELRPSDIRAVGQADFVIYAGYETMVERLLATAENSDTQPIQITTVHARPVMRASVMKIAEALGTVDTAEERLDELFGVLDDWQSELEGYGLHDVPVVAHFHQRALAESLGMNVVGVFGPAPLEARQIDEISRLDPSLIIDNGHNPIATPLEETTDATITVWYNFPGTGGTRTLLDIFAYNRNDLRSALAD